MKVLSLKLRDDVFDEVEQVIKKNNMPRNAYINEALIFFNQLNKRKWMRKKLQKESLLTRGVSMEVLREMEKLEDSLDS